MHTARRFFEVVDGAFHRVCQLLAVATTAILAVQAVLLFTQVIARYFFGASQHWIDELSRIGLVWLVFLGAALLTREMRHMQITYFVDRLPARFRHGLDMLTSALLIAALAMFLTGAIDAWDAAGRLSTPSLGLPRTIMTAPVIGGFALSLVFMIEILARLALRMSPPRSALGHSDASASEAMSTS